MKKVIFLLISVVLLVSFGFAGYAFAIQSIQAETVQYPIKINGVEIDTAIPMVNIEGRVYMQLRELCNVLGIGIDWNEKESAVEMMTDKVEIGYYGIDGWTKTDLADLSITKETAVVIAEDVFLQQMGKDFVNKTIVGVRETDDKECYSVFRYEEDVDGGDYSIIIRKSDGKILRIAAGE
jgi:hypothetical protein